MNPVGFGDINYAGPSIEFTGDALDLRAQNLNDALSSVRVPAGVTVTLYQDINRGGQSLVLTADAPDLRAFSGPGPDGTWNDVASSVTVSGASTSADGAVRLKRGGQYVEVDGAGLVHLVSNPTDAGLVVLTKHDGDTFDARFVQANRQLAFHNDGSLGTAPAGDFDATTQFQVRATTQPDGVNFLYREDGTRAFGEPLLIEAN